MPHRRKKKIPITQFNIGDTFEQFQDGNAHHWGSFKIIDKTNDGYMISCYSCTPEFVSNSAIVEVDYTGQELQNIYEQEILELIRAVNNKLYDQGDAVHEMWNAWTWEPEPAEMVIRLQEENMVIVGYFELTNYQKAGYSNDLDIGIVAECIDTGNRIWCHSRRVWYLDWKRDFPELWKKAMEEL